MTKRECAQLIMALKTYYPRENLIPNDQAAQLWFYQLQDLDYKTTEAALNAWVATQKWSPSIAELRAEATKISKGEALDWSEAWEQVRQAVRYFGFYDSEGALASLDELTREAAKRIGWQQICHSETPDVIRANFRIIYEALAKRKEKNTQLPPQLKRQIESLREPRLEEAHPQREAIEDKSEAAEDEQRTEPEKVSEMIKSLFAEQGWDYPEEKEDTRA